MCGLVLTAISSTAQSVESDNRQQPTLEAVGWKDVASLYTGACTVVPCLRLTPHRKSIRPFRYRIKNSACDDFLVAGSSGQKLYQRIFRTRLGGARMEDWKSMSDVVELVALRLPAERKRRLLRIGRVNVNAKFHIVG